MTRTRLRTGFSLVELLVVIGIITVLIGITMSAVGSARRQAKTVVCLAKQRELGNAAAMYLQLHRGYLPLSGDLDTTETPDGVDDPDRRRYQWADDPARPGHQHMLPFHQALGALLGDRTPDGYVGQNTFKWALCPTYDLSHAVLEDERGWAHYYRTTDGGGVNAHATYIFNEGVFGWNDAMGRKRGQMARVHRTSETLMLMDGNRSMTRESADTKYGWATVTNHVPPPVTLADAFVENGKASSTDNFDHWRHKGQINLLMMDGHAETRRITEGDLANVFLIAE